ncbi:MAG: hypothetical protein WKG00_34945, partial [Polyangiaceae bacterium]
MLEHLPELLRVQWRILHAPAEQLVMAATRVDVHDRHLQLLPRVEPCMRVVHGVSIDERQRPRHRVAEGAPRRQEGDDQAIVTLLGEQLDHRLLVHGVVLSVRHPFDVGLGVAGVMHAHL